MNGLAGPFHTAFGVILTWDAGLGAGGEPRILNRD